VGKVRRTLAGGLSDGGESDGNGERSRRARAASHPVTPETVGEHGKGSAAACDNTGGAAVATSRDAKRLCRLSAKSLKAGEHEEALAFAQQAVEADEGSAEALTARALAYVALAEPALAIEDFTRALSLDQRLVEAYYGRGRAHYDMAEYLSTADAAAIKSGERADGRRSLARRAAAAHREGHFERAILDFTEAIGLQAKHAEAYLCRAKAFQHLGLYDDAIADFDTAIALNSKIGEAYLGRGIAYVAKGEYPRAIPDFHKAEELLQAKYR